MHVVPYGEAVTQGSRGFPGAPGYPRKSAHHSPLAYGEAVTQDSTKTLTDRLRMREAEGRISRHYEPSVPPQVTYAITDKVLELDGAMIELDRIAERWYGGGGASG